MITGPGEWFFIPFGCLPVAGKPHFLIAARNYYTGL